jgi:preprotein translocase subunit SecB
MSQQQAYRFAVNKVFTKDVSFESPRAPEVFTKEFRPKMDVNLATEVTRLDEEIYEVVLTVNVEVKQEDQVAFLVELKQAGIFVVGGFEQAELDAMLGAYCPNVLFPFAREAVSDLAVRGGFPQLLLEPVNFDALYAQQKQALGSADASPA